VPRLLSLQILFVLQIIHSLGWRHRDVRPSNILWAEKHRQLMLIDFGFACESGSQYVSGSSTLAWFRLWAGLWAPAPCLCGSLAAPCSSQLSRVWTVLGEVLALLHVCSSRVFCREYSGAKHFVSKSVFTHMTTTPTLPYTFLRKDDLHSWLRVCLVHSDPSLASLVYGAMKSDGRLGLHAWFSFCLMCVGEVPQSRSCTY
jgi:serine/threonine protein kinase